MRIFDGHTHLGLAEGDGKILEELDKAGVFGACVFSAPPLEFSKKMGKAFDIRLSEVLNFCDGERLFPILWIHPYEDNIFENITKAAHMGICGFKIICSDFYIYEEKALEVLRHIASLNKPVFFHTGILWGDGTPSSSYNRPLNWEALISIKGLRFSMGHCSWPWIDECIALYGMFLNALLKNDTAEMFLDLTPGTPEIYREELLTKLLNVGYDVGNNIFFGTDCTVENYSSDWAKKWLETDRKIMEREGVSKEILKNIYERNLMRFLGLSEASVSKKSPSIDDANAWSAVNPAVSAIIEKWYEKLSFPQEFDAKFKNALAEIKISDAISIDSYDLHSKDGARNLLSFLYFCEQLEQKYIEKGIDLNILYDTLSDIRIWTEVWSDIKGSLYLGELSWLSRHLSMKLFKLGRLQFCFGKAERDIPKRGISKGDNIIEIHIPNGKPLTPEECEKSLYMAREFFSRFFPDYNYKGFTCHSWLLDETLIDLLGESSNIVKFMNLFDIVYTEESDSIFKYLFNWDTTRRKLPNLFPASSFAEKIKTLALKGRVFYQGYGIIK